MQIKVPVIYIWSNPASFTNKLSKSEISEYSFLIANGLAHGNGLYSVATRPHRFRGEHQSTL